MSFQDILTQWDRQSPLAFETSSLEETWELAAALAAILPHDLTLALYGDLGAGKTAFVKGLAKAWKIPGPITSPTFNLMNLYQGQRQLVHIDAYRLESPDAWDDLMVEDFLTSPWCLAIEWANRIPNAWSGPTWNLHFERLPTGKHRLTLSGASLS